MLFVFLLIIRTVSAQEIQIVQKDLSDVLQDLKKIKSSPKNHHLETHKLYFSPLPIIGYGPANGFVAGGGLSIASLLGSEKNTRISSALMNLNFTTKKQIYLNFRSNIYLPDDRWILQGDWRLMLFAQPTFGLGISDIPLTRFIFSINGIETAEEPQAQPMRFNYIRFYENIYKKISKNFYAGIGINIDYHYNIQDEKMSLTLPSILLTAHYLYNKSNGFSTTKYSTNGMSLNFMYDSRDNSINAYKGIFAQLSFRTNTEWMGSSKASNTLFYDYRTYIQPNATKPKNILALWSWAQFLTGGSLPYLALPSITWDMYNRSGRGSIQGRFRGENMFYAEAEYRFPITSNGLWGGVAFVNTTTASNNAAGQKIFDAMAPGYGAGLRLKMSKKTRTNIGMDIGFGRYHAGGVYFNLQEAF